MPDETPPVEIAAEAERPEWLAAEFDNPEAQAKAYADARTEMKRAQSALAEERKQFTEALSSLQQQEPQRQQYDPNADPTVVAYARAMEEGDAATMLAIQMQISSAATQQAVKQGFEEFGPQMQQGSAADREMALQLAEQRVAAQFGDRWGEIAPKVNAILSERPGVLPANITVEGYAEAIRQQANLIEAERIVGRDRQQEAERQAKLAGQTLGGETGRIPTDTDEKRTEWGKVKGAETGGYAQKFGG